MKKGNILVIDDNKNVLTALRILLENYFENVMLLSSPKQLISVMREFSPDIVLLDMNFSAGINTGNEGLFWLSEIKKQDVDLPVVQSGSENPKTLDEAEKRLIENSLKRNHDNLSAVAVELGITRPTLYSKMKKYCIGDISNINFLNQNISNK